MPYSRQATGYRAGPRAPASRAGRGSRRGARRHDRLRAIPSVFARVDAYSDARPRPLADFERRLEIGTITATLPDFLGVAPQLGRGFNEADVLAGDRIILSDTYWLNAYSRSRDVLGETLSFSDGTYIIAGVMPT